MAVTLPRGRAIPPRHIEYPTSDGKPMAETDKHRNLMVYFIEALKAFFAARSAAVYVSGNNFLYWEEGSPKKCVSPDCYVVFGVSPTARDSYMTWKEGGRLPSVVFEFTSRKTRKEDTQAKRPLYELVLKVEEYSLFDPSGDYLRPRLQGYRMAGAEYEPLELVEGRLYSEQLGLGLVEEGENLYLYDPERRERLLTPVELARRVEEESAARTAAEAESTRLRAEVEALRRQLGQQ